MLDKTQKELIERYLKGQRTIDVAYLFGSQTTNKSNNLSDVDIAVLFKQKLSTNTRFSEKLRLMGGLSDILQRNDVEVVDLNSANTPLRFSAIENRSLLTVNSNLERVLFEADTMSRYQDYKYYLDLNTKNSLASISRMEA